MGLGMPLLIGILAIAALYYYLFLFLDLYHGKYDGSSKEFYWDLIPFSWWIRSIRKKIAKLDE